MSGLKTRFLLPLLALPEQTFYLFLWRAHRDHAKLPYSAYRTTNLYIRVQARALLSPPHSAHPLLPLQLASAQSCSP